MEGTANGFLVGVGYWEKATFDGWLPLKNRRELEKPTSAWSLYECQQGRQRGGRGDCSAIEKWESPLYHDPFISKQEFRRSGE
jgi:hypothetical protein